MITFICGGVRSGKSSWGEARAETFKQKNGRLIYLATASASDLEMQKRISRHKQSRISKKMPWTTYEKPSDLQDCAGDFKRQDVVFIDCLTTWLSHEMFGAYTPMASSLKEKIMIAISSLEKACYHLFIISNDVFQEGVPEDQTTFLYMKTLGELHQQLASQANYIISMEFGKPLVMKGGGSNEGTYGLGNNI